MIFLQNLIEAVLLKYTDRLNLGELLQVDGISVNLNTDILK